jgi:WD40 repeat protein
MPRSSSKSYKMTVGYEIACSNQHKLVACIGGRINIFDVEQRQKIVSCRPIANPSDAAFSPNGRFLAVKSTRGRIVVLNSFTGEVICDHKNQKEGEGCEVHFSPDGEMLIDASWDGWITVRKAFEPKIVSREEFPREMICQISHDLSRRKWLFMHIPKLQPGQKCNDPSYLILRDWPFGENNFQRIPLDPDISSSHTATISPDASRICYEHNVYRVHRVCILRAEDGKVETIANTDGVRGRLVWSWDCQIIAAAQRFKGESKFTFYRSSDLSVLGEVPCEYPDSICFLPDTDQVVLGSWRFSRLARLEDFLSGLVKMRK